MGAVSKDLAVAVKEMGAYTSVLIFRSVVECCDHALVGLDGVRELLALVEKRGKFWARPINPTKERAAHNPTLSSPLPAGGGMMIGFW